jgi:predicted transposase/invertase (TIGR01784 family)
MERSLWRVVNMLMTEWNTVEYGEVQREEGREEGREAKALETAKNFLIMGLAPEQVANGTGLSVGTVKELASTLGTQTAL